MAQPNFDPNQWYSIFLNGGQGLAGTWLFNRNKTTGASLMKTRDSSDGEQLWQIFQLNSTTWTMRSQASGPVGFLMSKWNASAQTQIVPIMAIGDIADTSALWTFNAWDDKTWKISNLANGTENRLQKNPLLSISSDAPAPPRGQGWNYTAVKAIDDPRYSSVSLLGTVAGVFTTSTASSITSGSPASSATTSANITPTANSNPNANGTASSPSGLSTAAKAGIGAGVGIVALVALVILGLFLWRKRKRQQPPAYTKAVPELGTETVYNEAPATTKYELHYDTSTKQFLYEAPSNERVSELQGHEVSR